MARMISTRSPSLSGVLAHASRRTTAPLSAIAKPFGPATSMPAVSARHSAARSSKAQSRSSPLTLTRMRSLLFLPACARREAREAEPRGRPRHGAGDHQVVDRLGGDRGEQDAVAMMTGRQYEARNAGGAQNGRIVVRGRPQAGPDRLDLHVLDRGQRTPRAFEQRK